MKWNLLVLLMLLLICGCGKPHTKLEQTTLRLKSGMNKPEVKQLFVGFGLSETNQVLKIELAKNTRSFGTNNMSHSSIVFTPKGFFSHYEYCSIHFDSNDVIICYDYYSE